MKERILKDIIDRNVSPTDTNLIKLIIYSKSRKTVNLFMKNYFESKRNTFKETNVNLCLHVLTWGLSAPASSEYRQDNYISLKESNNTQTARSHQGTYDLYTQGNHHQIITLTDSTKIIDIYDSRRQNIGKILHITQTQATINSTLTPGSAVASSRPRRNILLLFQHH